MESSALDDAVDAARGSPRRKLNNRFNATIAASVGLQPNGAGVRPGVSEPARQAVAPGGREHADDPVGRRPCGRRSGARRRSADDGEQQGRIATRSSRTRASRCFSCSRRSATCCISAKADTVAQKRFEVAKNRYIIGKIGISDLFIAQSEKDAAVLAYVQALRTYWTSYYHLRRVTLYDFATKQELADDRER